MLENASLLANDLLSAENHVAISVAASYVGVKLFFVGLDLGNRFGLLDRALEEKVIAKSRDFVPLASTLVEGKRIEGLGVTHLAETFVRNELKIRSKIADSHFVVVEHFGNGIKDLAKPEITSEDLLNERQSYNSRAWAFFAGVGKICAEQGKDIFVVNPQSNLNLFFDANSLIGIPMYLLTSGLAEVSYEPSGLREALIVATLARWLSSHRLPYKVRDYLEDSNFFPPSTVPRDERAMTLGWSLNDYRDIRSSLGIRKILKVNGDEFPAGQALLYIQGAGHNGVAEYLRRPYLARFKQLIYPHYHLTRTRGIRRFHFNQQENQWELKQKIPF